MKKRAQETMKSNRSDVVDGACAPGTLTENI